MGYGRTLLRQSFDGKKTAVPSSTSETLLASTNASRSGLSIYNDSTAILSIVLGPAGELAASGPDVKIAAGGYYEAPVGWCGPVYGQWDAANGFARVKEYK